MFDEQCYSSDIMLHPATDTYTSTACSQPVGMAWEVGYCFWVSLQNGVRATHIPCGKEYMFQLGRLNRPNQPSASCKNYKIHLHTFFSSVIQIPSTTWHPPASLCTIWCFDKPKCLHLRGHYKWLRLTVTPGKSYSMNKIHFYGCGSISPQASYNLTCNSYL